MELPATKFQPLSVSRGLRDPFRMVEGIPEHMRPALDSWTCNTLYGLPGDVADNLHTLSNLLRLNLNSWHPERFVSAVARNDDDYLDLLHELLRLGVPSQDRLDTVLALGGSVWRVADSGDGLEARVSAEARESYSRALEVHERAAEFLSDAWRHAFGLSPDAGDAWSDAIKALEAVLSPIVIPKARLSKLSDIQSAVRQAPEGKFLIRAAGRDPKKALSGMLDAVPYEPGRHGSDPTKAELKTARIVVLQTTAIIAAVGEGLIEEPGSTSDDVEE